MFNRCMRTRYHGLDAEIFADENRESLLCSKDCFEDSFSTRGTMTLSLGTLLMDHENDENSNSKQPQDIGWEDPRNYKPQNEHRISAEHHHRLSTRLSNLDLFESAKPFYTWSTTQQSRHTSLSHCAGYDNVIATKRLGGNSWGCSVKGNMVMHQGVHYFEIDLMPGSSGGMMVGVGREDVDPNACHHTWYGDNPQRAWLMFAMLGERGTNSFASGDRIGVHVDLQEGVLNFYKNGKLVRRPKQASGRVWQKLAAPVVPLVQLFDEGDAVKFISDVTLPELVVEQSRLP